MNGGLSQNEELLSDIKKGLTPDIKKTCDYLICVPSIYILNAKTLCDGTAIAYGAQDCSVHESGAYTGEVSAPMIADCGASYIIVGHSERRQYHNERDQLVAEKAQAAHEAGLTAIICIGESEQEREAGLEEKVVGTQLLQSLPASATADNTVIAYEPVWAIGTGKTAQPDDVAKIHSFIREKLKERLADSQNMRILYGGSMKPENAKDLLATPNVDGGLIGGASLKAEQFIAIGQAAADIA